MELLKEQNFHFKRKIFNLKLYKSDDSFTIIAFFEGRQVSPSYSISFETNIDYFKQYQENFFGNLFELVKSDIEEGLYINV